jgi:Ribonuclease G/E
MSQRRLYLDAAPGELRGVVALDGLPERLLIARFDDRAVQQPGARVAARVRKIEPSLKTAFLDLGEGPDAVLPLAGLTAKTIHEGAWLEVQVVSEARAGKGAATRMVGPGNGPPRLIAPAPELRARLQAFAPGVEIVGGAPAREAADLAEHIALAVEHALPGGGRIFIEPTQALTAIDVDLAAATGDGRRAQARANREAIAAAARLLRLKGLAGLVAIDLAGKGHDGATLSAAAKAAFAPDGDGVSIGPISRFGVLELVVPRTTAPLADRWLDPGGGFSAVTVALRLLRAIERAAGPGQTVEARCAPDVASIAERLAPELTHRIGPRFHIRSDPAKSRTDIEVAPR